MAFKALQYANEKARELRDRHLRIEQRVEGGYWSDLLSNHDTISIYAREPGDRVDCSILGHSLRVEAEKWIAEALEKKRNKAYGAGVHLLIDNQTIFVDPQDVAWALNNEPVVMPDFAAVWLVTIGQPTARLDVL